MSVVLAYRPKPKSKPAKKWKRQADKIERLTTSRRRRIVSHGNRPPLQPRIYVGRGFTAVTKPAAHRSLIPTYYSGEPPLRPPQQGQAFTAPSRSHAESVKWLILVRLNRMNSSSVLRSAASASINALAAGKLSDADHHSYWQYWQRIVVTYSQSWTTASIVSLSCPSCTTATASDPSTSAR